MGCGKFTNISYDKNFYFTKKYLKKFYYYFKLFKDLFKKHQYNLQIISNNIIYEEEVFMFLFLAINNVAGFRVRGLDNKINDGKITLYLLN